MNGPIDIIPFDDSLAAAFRDLNLAWVEKYFTVEPMDVQVLSRPKEYIIDRGGQVFFARVNGAIAGTFALIPKGGGIFELGKMAVDERFQGRGVGNRLMEACIREAGKLGAGKLILYSNTILGPALHLYRKYGFVEVPLENS